MILYRQSAEVWEYDDDGFHAFLLNVIRWSMLNMAGLRATKYFMPVVNWNNMMRYMLKRGIEINTPYNTNDMNVSA